MTNKKPGLSHSASKAKQQQRGNGRGNGAATLNSGLLALGQPAKAFTTARF